MFKAFELASGRELWSIETDLSKDGSWAVLGSVAMSADGRSLATIERLIERLAEPASAGGQISSLKLRCCVRDTRTGKTLRTLDAPESFGTIQSWSADGKRLALLHSPFSPFAAGKLLSVIDAETGKVIMSVDAQPGNVQSLSSVAFSPDGNRIAGVMIPNATGLVVGRGDGGVKVWDVATGNEMLSLPWNSDRPRNAPTRFGNAQIAFTPDGNQIVQFTARMPFINPLSLPTATVRFIDATPVSAK
jgi:WD40 repeat protein